MDEIGLEWVLSLLGGGALVTVIGGLIAAVIQSKREHRKWVRERRYEAYVQIQSLISEMTYVMQTLLRGAQERVAALESAAKDGQTPDPLDLKYEREAVEDAGERVQRLFDRFHQAASPLAIVGPREVSDAAYRAMDAAHHEPDALRAEVAEFQRLAREAIRVRPRS